MEFISSRAAKERGKNNRRKLPHFERSWRIQISQQSLKSINFVLNRSTARKEDITEAARLQNLFHGERAKKEKENSKREEERRLTG